MAKKALMAVSFGTSYPRARADIAQIEAVLQKARPEYDFFRAFTSGMIIRKIAKEEGISIETPEALAARLAQDGYEEVICQSLHVIPGNEYEKLCEQLEKNRFKRLEIGKPLLWQDTDYLRCGRALLGHFPKLAQDEALVFMGHGTDHQANASYALMENTFRFLGAERVYIATVEGFPNFDYILRRLHKREVNKVYLAPFMIVAGDHAQNDLAGEQEDSWLSMLQKEDYEVEVLLRGLGAFPEIAELFASHLPV